MWVCFFWLQCTVTAILVGDSLRLIGFALLWLQCTVRHSLRLFGFALLWLQCTSPKELLQLFHLPLAGLSADDFILLCPALLFQIDSGTCRRPLHDHNHDHEHAAQQSKFFTLPGKGKNSVGKDGDLRSCGRVQKGMSPLAVCVCVCVRVWQCGGIAQTGIYLLSVCVAVLGYSTNRYLSAERVSVAV